MRFSRLSHGLLWGMVATVVAGVIPLVGLATGAWPGPGSLSTAFVARLTGAPATSAAAYVLAALGQLVYGGFWGAFVAYANQPTSAWSALGAGLLRWFVASWMVMPFVGWGEFGFFTGLATSVASLTWCLAFAALTGFLVHRQEAGAPLRLPGLHRRHALRLAPVTRARTPAPRRP